MTLTRRRRRLHPLSFGLTNGKGGVGKTTSVTHLGAFYAAAGYRVLLCDLDPQGNLRSDLGYATHDGKELFAALLTGNAPPIISNVGGRANLDVVPGGLTLFDLAPMMIARQQTQPGSPRLSDLILTSLQHVADNYDIIIFDTPPGDLAIIDAVLELVDAIIIPVRADDASFEGVELIAKRFAQARDGGAGQPAINPGLRLAGVLLFDISSRAENLARSARAAVEEIIGDTAPVFQQRIRHLETAAYDTRRFGLLAHELEQHTDHAKAERLRALRTGERLNDLPLVRTASGLAEDWQNLSKEVLLRLAELDSEEIPA